METILKEIFSLLYFFLPAYFCNMTPPIAKRLKILESLAFPINGGKIFFDKKPFLGSHKTWRGAILGFLVGYFVFLIQKILFSFAFFQKISLIDYSQKKAFLFAFLLLLGAIFGDLFFAFVKRRLNLKEGAPFLPFDQTNYVIGAAIFAGPFLKFSFLFWVKLFFLTFFLHVFFNRLGYWFGIHKAKW